MAGLSLASGSTAQPQGALQNQNYQNQLNAAKAWGQLPVQQQHKMDIERMHAMFGTGPEVVNVGGSGRASASAGSASSGGSKISYPGASATFAPTASGLFADASNPFGGQRVGQRLAGKQNLLGATAPSAGGVAGSIKIPPHPFMG